MSQNFKYKNLALWILQTSKTLSVVMVRGEGGVVDNLVFPISCPSQHTGLCCHFVYNFKFEYRRLLIRKGEHASLVFVVFELSIVNFQTAYKMMSQPSILARKRKTQISTTGGTNGLGLVWVWSGLSLGSIIPIYESGKIRV